MFTVINKVKSFFSNGDERLMKAKLNSLYMFLIQGASMFIGLLLVPITLNYVDNATYGVWLTLSTMVLWIRVLDIGINSGLKNKLAEALALKRSDLAKKYISTTYAILSLIFIPVMLLLMIIAQLVDWNTFLNIPGVNSRILVVSISIIIAYFCLNFILSTINVVLIADQRPANASFRNLIQQFVSLVIIGGLTLVTKGSLVLLCLGLCFSPLIVVLFYNILLFRKDYKEIRPSFQSIDFKVAPTLLSLGVKFFIIQICFIIQYQISNFLILKFYGVADVTSYNISFKYFNVLHGIWLTIITPIWAATTDAVTKNEFHWVKDIMIKYSRLFGLFIVMFLGMLLVSEFAFHIWVGDKVSIPLSYSFWIMAYNIVICFGAIYINILNGSGVLMVQTFSSIFAPILFLGAFFIMYSYGVGVISIPLAGIISSINGLLFAPIQCYMIFVKNKKKGSSFFFK